MPVAVAAPRTSPGFQDSPPTLASVVCRPLSATVPLTIHLPGKPIVHHQLPVLFEEALTCDPKPESLQVATANVLRQLTDSARRLADAAGGRRPVDLVRPTEWTAVVRIGAPGAASGNGGECLVYRCKFDPRPEGDIAAVVGAKFFRPGKHPLECAFVLSLRGEGVECRDVSHPYVPGRTNVRLQFARHLSDLVFRRGCELWEATEAGRRAATVTDCDRLMAELMTSAEGGAASDPLERSSMPARRKKK